MLKILIDGIIYGMQRHGGINRYFNETLTRIEQNDCGIQLFLHLPASAGELVPQSSMIRIIRNHSFRPRRIFKNLSNRISKTNIRLMKPQIFHSTYFSRPYWPGLKTVVTVHDCIYEKYPSLLPYAQKFIEHKKNIIESADAVIAVSQETKNDLLIYNKIEESKIFVIYHGASENFRSSLLVEDDILNFREKYKINGIYWLYVGRRGNYKNFSTLLRAFIKVSSEMNCSLVVVGGEPTLEPWQEDLLIRNRLERRIYHLRDINDEELLNAYVGSSAFIYPSLAEGFGIPLLEAMSAGTPVVASDIGVFREIAADAAYYFDPWDENILAKAMIEVLDTKTREDLIEKGRRRIGRFSWDEAACQLANIYRSIV